MSLSIDVTTYRKDSRWPLGRGYSGDRGRPTSIVVHTTNGHIGSAFAAEAAYLRDAAGVSCHYLVGKAGQIAQILPDHFLAWHAGDAIPGFGNAESIGIECHLTPGEAWTPAQRQALADLCRLLMQRYTIPIARIETHRRIALPAGRKIDPSEWSDVAFYAWRDLLDAPQPDPWLEWGAAGHPIAAHQQPWAIAQAWLRERARLGPATSKHSYPDGKTVYVTFRNGIIWQAPGRPPVVEVYL